MTEPEAPGPLSVLLRTVQVPTAIVDSQRVLANLTRMQTKAAESGARLRPHFKTHNSVQVGELLRRRGVSSITVSSIPMAIRFAAAGWTDIVIGFPLNIRTLDELAALSQVITLGVTVDCPPALASLVERTDIECHVWIEIDTGYGRTGVPSDDDEAVLALAAQVSSAAHLTLAGLATHAGQSYAASSLAELREVHMTTAAAVLRLRDTLSQRGFGSVAIAIGDTPSCSAIDSFAEVDEVRAGNFLYFDQQQLELGVCTAGDLALVIACPVVDVYPRRGQIVLHGGAVHLSKDQSRSGAFGLIAASDGFSWRVLDESVARVSSVSQEHGVITAEPAVFRGLRVGDVALVVPAHACLAANALGEPLLLEPDHPNSEELAS